ncbi:MULTISPECIES: hypothetical protein [unclassified Chelatococcus]|uniref:hypothetical protein n=1 Tax=unclassified Chelatococcus TaxID=2638111 RepID=UPI000AA99F9B|nr:MULTISPECIES: hypothetical protein [unclassified Chelatococcus]
MPGVSGREIISDTTEKSFRALVLISATTILTKAYAVPLDEMTLFGAKLPQALFDAALLAAVCGLLYVYVVKWAGDLAAFRLWFSDSSLWSEFGTHQKIDKSFIAGGVKLLLALHEQEKIGNLKLSNLPPDIKKEYDDFKLNVELYAVRLGAAGRKFSILTCFGRFYIWVQHFIFPVGLAGYAICLLIRFGDFSAPARL